jgi:hypothetical protein
VLVLGLWRQGNASCRCVVVVVATAPALTPALAFQLPNRQLSTAVGSRASCTQCHRGGFFTLVR